MNTMRHRRVLRGVSLIEAVVALAVMAFGLVAIVGLQATLRSNADVSKQRTEALRLAQEEIERWRAFVSVQADAGVDFVDIDTVPETQTVGQNATFTVSRTVPPMQPPAPKTVSISVSWVDRSGQPQVVALNSAIAGISPELAGSLVLPQNSKDRTQVDGRSPMIPRAARNLGDGTSGFVPPQGSGQKVAWVFNHVTGLIERTCTVDADASTETLTAASVAANRASCDTSRTAQLLSGYVNFANPLVQPDEAEAEAPTGLPLNLDMALTLTSAGHPDPGAVCFDDSPSAQVTGARAVTYFCAIYSNTARTWSGRLSVVPLAFESKDALAWSIGSESADRLVCRYTTLENDGNDESPNSAHPLDYSLSGSAPGAALRNQNFLVIRGSHNCPTDALSSTDPVNSNTRVHQNGAKSST